MSAKQISRHEMFEPLPVFTNVRPMGIIAPKAKRVRANDAETVRRQLKKNTVEWRD